FRCRDGAVQIAVGSEALWQRFCHAFGLDPDAEGMRTNPERVAHRDQVVATVEEVFAAHDADALLTLLSDAGVPAGRVRTLDEVYAWEQTASQGLLVDVDHTSLGTATLPGRALRFFDPSGDEVTRRDHQAPPVIDEHAARIGALLGQDTPCPAAGPRASCSTSSSTRAASSRGTRPSTPRATRTTTARCSRRPQRSRAP